MGELRNVAAVRRLAEERAQAFHRAVFGRFADGSRKTQWVEAQLDLLCDLARPESRDAVVRLVAEKVELDTSAGLMLRRSAPYWILCAGPQVEDGEQWDGELDFGSTPSGDWPRRQIFALATVADPAEALRIIALHVLGESDV